jgi:hypothetical protein
MTYDDQKGDPMLKMRNALGRRRRRTEPEVRFHSGPQGRPVPCFDEHCPNPHLKIEGG